MAVLDVLDGISALVTHLNADVEHLAVEAANEMLRSELLPGAANDEVGFSTDGEETLHPLEPGPEEPYWVDPRADDLEEDHAWWVMVLGLARGVDERLYGALHGVRCFGGKLTEKEGRLRLTGRKGEGWATSNDFAVDYRRWLLPYADQLAEILSSNRLVLSQ